MKKKPQLKHLPRFIKKKWFWFIANWSRKSEILTLFISRPKVWRLTGAKVGKNVSITLGAYYDVGNAHLINIEDNVGISNFSILICHKRDMTKYFKGDQILDTPFILAPIHLKKGSYIGMGAMVMPGVTVGEGAIVGARSLVTKDVPPWTIVAGVPAKIVGEVKERPLNQ